MKLEEALKIWFLRILTQRHDCWFLGRQAGKGTERERSINQLRLARAPSGDGTSKPGKCPDRELNP